MLRYKKMLPNVTWVKQGVSQRAKRHFPQFWSMILCFWKVKCQIQAYSKTVNTGKTVNTSKTVNTGKTVNTVTVIGPYCFYWDSNIAKPIILFLLL